MYSFLTTSELNNFNNFYELVLEAIFLLDKIGYKGYIQFYWHLQNT